VDSLRTWLNYRVGLDYYPERGLWFRPNGSLPGSILWGPSKMHGRQNGWWIAPYDADGNFKHLVPFTALTWPG
jgi:hypothetical protein